MTKKPFGFGLEEWLYLQKRGIKINPIQPGIHRCDGVMGNTKFFFVWIGDCFLTLTMDRFNHLLEEALTKALKCQPLCRYYYCNMWTVEWSPYGREERITFLRNDPAVSTLIEIA